MVYQLDSRQVRAPGNISLATMTKVKPGHYPSPNLVPQDMSPNGRWSRWVSSWCVDAGGKGATPGRSGSFPCGARTACRHIHCLP